VNRVCVLMGRQRSVIRKHSTFPIGDKPEIWRVALTGGPCGGKSTCMASIDERMTLLGYKVFRVPEAATMLITGGIGFGPAYSEQCTVKTQTGLIKTQMTLEDCFYAHAYHSCQKAVVLCDRGAMDSTAYMSEEQFATMCAAEGWDETKLRDERYDHVLHLVTAAIGAEEFYTTQNNAARLETAEQAAELDNRIAKAWIGHEHLRILDNSTGFAEKVERAVQSICKRVGEPVPTGHKRYFLLDPRCFKALKEVKGLKTVSMQLEYTYLRREPKQPRVRIERRGENYPYVYTYTTRVRGSGGDTEHEDLAHDVKRPISGRDFRLLLKQASPTHDTLVKERQVFMWNNTAWEVDVLREPEVYRGMCFLAVDALEEQKHRKLELPSFLQKYIIQEVTNDERYRSYDLSKQPIRFPRRRDT